MKNNENQSLNTVHIAAELRAQLSKIRRRLREHADPGDLTSSQMAVILRLESLDKSVISDLARMEGVRHQSMRNTVSALIELGYIDTEPDPEDGRKTYLSLSEKCKNMLSEGRTAWNDWLADAISGKLTLEEQKCLCNSIEIIKKLTSN